MIQDELQAQVAGTVKRLFSTRNGTACVIESQRQGSRYPDRVTVFGIREQLREGDRVRVRGELSWRKTERDGKTYMDVHLNGPAVIEHEQGSPAPATQSDDVPW